MVSETPYILTRKISQLLKSLGEATTNGPNKEHDYGEQQHRLPAQNVTQSGEDQKKSRVRQ